MVGMFMGKKDPREAGGVGAGLADTGFQFARREAGINEKFAASGADQQAVSRASAGKNDNLHGYRMRPQRGPKGQ